MTRTEGIFSRYRRTINSYNNIKILNFLLCLWEIVKISFTEFWCVTAVIAKHEKLYKGLLICYIKLCFIGIQAFSVWFSILSFRINQKLKLEWDQMFSFQSEVDLKFSRLFSGKTSYTAVISWEFMYRNALHQQSFETSLIPATSV